MLSQKEKGLSQKHAKDLLASAIYCSFCERSTKNHCDLEKQVLPMSLAMHGGDDVGPNGWICLRKLQMLVEAAVMWCSKSVAAPSSVAWCSYILRLSVGENEHQMLLVTGRIEWWLLQVDADASSVGFRFMLHSTSTFQLEN
ncbi:unnamed protein product [Cylindrotheca closterium]|uniref:Uncharacterized protein n=1 Tax=Cylindrotheca closterium TaxID=2856 RepID=A0AAD2CKR6_9STRA|nr:unnamed protein product [Cylindrotheca closterium]